VVNHHLSVLNVFDLHVGKGLLVLALALGLAQGGEKGWAYPSRSSKDSSIQTLNKRSPIMGKAVPVNEAFDLRAWQDTPLTPQELSTQWIYIGHYQDGAEDYLDPTSLRFQGSLVYSRTKTVLPSKIELDVPGKTFSPSESDIHYWVSEAEDDCKQRTNRILRIQGFNANHQSVSEKTFLKAEPVQVSPESNGGFFQNLVCPR
jgi:glycerol-3-phosphate cytidylyltransferase-like family protein